MNTLQSTRFRHLIFTHLRESRLALAGAALCMVGSTATALLSPWPLKLIFDHLLLGKPVPDYLSFAGPYMNYGNMTGLALLAATILLLAVLTGLFSFAETLLTARIGYQLVFRLRGELFEHLQRLSLSFHSRARSGELMSKVISDTNALKDVFAASALSLATSVLTMIGMFTIVFALNWRLGLILLISFVVLFFAGYFLLRNVMSVMRLQRKREGRVASRISEVLSAVPLVQSFGRERYERERFETQSAASVEDGIRSARIDAAAGRIVDLVSAIATSGVVLFGGLQVFHGAISPGAMLILISYTRSMYKPLRLITKLSTKFSKAGVSAERISEILETEPDIQDAPDAIEVTGLRGEIVFDRVSFDYGDGTPVLRNVSLRIPAGHRAALVGASGAGKSTIANLILRLYDPREGSISIDGVDIKRFRGESLRQSIGVVLQEAMLLATSIRENIAYGKPDATDDEIVEAAKQAHAHEFILQLPEGYDTEIGERGVTLSGGQRQRIALARAIVRRAPILIMDEPTSAVDARSEQLIAEAAQRAQSGRTTLLIAHQVSSIMHYDLIFVLKDGVIVEQGTHNELVQREGHYYELFRLQVE